MNKYRRNADERLRELERRAASGDPAAREAVVRERLRTGTLTVDWLLSAGVEAARLLPEHVRAGLLANLSLAHMTRAPGTNDEGEQVGGWFPGHRSVTECPRGHHVEETWPGGFLYEEVLREHRSVVLDEGEVFIGDPVDSDRWPVTTTLFCRACAATWPADDSRLEY